MRIKETIDVELDSGKVIPIEIEYHIIHCPNYGADADGNRGVATRILDEFDFLLPDGLEKDEIIQINKQIDDYIKSIMSELSLVSEDPT